MIGKGLRRRIAQLADPSIYEAPASEFSPDAPEEDTGEDPYAIYCTTPLIRTSVNIIANLTSIRGFRFEGDPDVCSDLRKLSKKLYMRRAIRVAERRRLIFGHGSFEIVGGNKAPDRLITMHGELSPNFNPDWEVESYKFTNEYTGETEDDFPADNVLYMPRDVVTPDLKGHSLVLALSKAISRRTQLDADLLEVAKSLWAPPWLFQVDLTSVRKKEDREAYLKAFLERVKPGRKAAFDEKFKLLNPEKTSPDVRALGESAKDADMEVVRAFNIPKELQGLGAAVTRAVLRDSIESMHDIIIKSEQEEIGDYLKEQLFDPYLGEKKAELYELVWLPITKREWREGSDQATKLYEAGVIDDEKIYDLLGWEKPPEEEEEKETSPKKPVTEKGDDEK
jgi:hypothetical protein